MEYNRLCIKKPVDEKEIDRDRLIRLRKDAGRIKIDIVNIEPRAIGELEFHAIHLPSVYDWVIGEDSRGEICLVPLKKTGGKK